MDEYGRNLIELARNIILSDKKDLDRIKNIESAMNDVYRYFKGVIKEPNFRDERLLEIFKLEQLMKDEFLPIDSEPYFEEDYSPILPITINNISDCEEVLRYIVHHTRVYLNNWSDIKNSSLKAKCITSSGYVAKLCEELNIRQIKFGCNENLSTGNFHHFNVVTFVLSNNEVKPFLVDCAYRQFFTYSDSFLERIGLPLNGGCCMGTYMLMDESRKSMAEKLLKNGYIEFTSDNIKNYFDGFVFQGRNGLYYEQLKKHTITSSDYIPHYNYEDYILALNGNGLSEEKFVGRMMNHLTTEIIFDTKDNDTVKKI